VAHLYFLQPHRPTQKNSKEPPSQRTKTADNERTYHDRKEQRRHNSTYKKLADQCSAATFVVNQTLFSASTFVVKIANFL